MVFWLLNLLPYYTTLVACCCFFWNNYDQHRSIVSQIFAIVSVFGTLVVISTNLYVDSERKVRLQLSLSNRKQQRRQRRRHRRHRRWWRWWRWWWLWQQIFLCPLLLCPWEWKDSLKLLYKYWLCTVATASSAASTLTVTPTPMSLLQHQLLQPWITTVLVAQMV